MTKDGPYVWQVQYGGQKVYKIMLSLPLEVRSPTETDISVYPNPVTEQFSVIADHFNGLLNLYDTMGKNVMSDTFAGNGTFNISKLSAGIYFLKLSTKDGLIKSTYKILKTE